MIGRTRVPRAARNVVVVVTTVEKRAIALLIPGYAAKDAARKEKPSQPTVTSRIRGGNTRVDDRTTQRRSSSRDPRRGRQSQSQAAPATQRCGPRRVQQAQFEGVQLSTTGLAHIAEQRQFKVASIASWRQTDHESYFKKVRHLEQSLLKSVAKLAWLTGKGNAKKTSGIKDYQLYLEIGNPLQRNLFNQRRKPPH